jgi:RNA polymerase sigma-70 factor (ECF subfamily)
VPVPVRFERARDAVATPLALVGDERDLVQRIRAGDAAAFEAMFHLYYGPLCAFTMGYVRSRHLAEEQVQDVLLWIWEQRERWDIRTGLRSYLYTAARNAALNSLKRQRVADRWEASAVNESRAAGPAADVRSVDDEIDRRDVARAIGHAIDRLPERRRQALTLRWQHRLSYAEIAQVMGITVKSVETSLAKAIDTLRRELAPSA